jgi:hypothetical protein
VDKQVDVILFLISSTMQNGDHVRKVVTSLALMLERRGKHIKEERKQARLA